MDILYVGSGLSALQVTSEKYSEHLAVALNNAWRLFESSPCDYWVHPDDFPRENYPPEHIYRHEIAHKSYNAVIQRSNILFGLGEHTGFKLECAIGYTSFFQGLYWIMANFRPEKIGLLGFDHDYNDEKLKKWQADDRPHIQNKFHNMKKTTIKAWADNYFAEYEPDSFYGHGTPDPLRFGRGYIEAKMKLAQETASRLGINIVNYSERPSSLNIFPREIR